MLGFFGALAQHFNGLAVEFAVVCGFGVLFGTQFASSVLQNLGKLGDFVFAHFGAQIFVGKFAVFLFFCRRVKGTAGVLYRNDQRSQFFCIFDRFAPFLCQLVGVMQQCLLGGGDSLQFCSQIV